LQAILYYAHDPMCSWCWGFVPVLQDLTERLPASVQLQRLLGGLAEDTDETMPDEQQQRIQATWRRIEQTIPGVHFNFDFWTTCRPRRSTWAACRAVIAARAQGEAFDRLMTRAIQRAYYLQARNPSDTATLIELAAEISLDVAQFRAALDSEQTVQQLRFEMQECDRLRIGSFPSLVLEAGSARWHVPVDYNDSAPMLALVDELLSAA
jgi:putative protein-disulfide isomerase